jgi:hypothetical protein
MARSAAAAGPACTVAWSHCQRYPLQTELASFAACRKTGNLAARPNNRVQRAPRRHILRCLAMLTAVREHTCLECLFLLTFSAAREGIARGGMTVQVLSDLQAAHLEVCSTYMAKVQAARHDSHGNEASGASTCCIKATSPRTPSKVAHVQVCCKRWKRVQGLWDGPLNKVRLSWATLLTAADLSWLTKRTLLDQDHLSSELTSQEI